MLGAGIGAAGLVLLNACADPHLQAPMDLGFVDGQPVFTNCGPALGPLERVSITESLDGESTAVLWATDGPALPSGGLLTTADSGWGDVERSALASLTPKSWLSVQVIADGRAHTAQFRIPDEGVPADQWISSAGSLTSAACEDHQ